MVAHYDEIIVGSGPCAYAYSLGIGKDEKRRLVVSTESLVSNDTEGADVPHGKLSFEGRRFIECNEGSSAFPVTSALGGLSNSWGGVLIEGGFDEFIQFFNATCTESEYNRALTSIIDDLSSYFSLKKVRLSNKHVAHLLDPGAKYGWENAGLSIERAFLTRLSSVNVSIKTGWKVTKVETGDQSISLRVEKNESNEVLSCDRLVLGAGTPGNIALLSLAGCSETPIICDHVPVQIACLTTKSKKEKLRQDLGSIHSPIAALMNNRDQFVALYDPLRISDKALIEMSGFAAARMCRAPLIKERLLLAQVWSKETYATTAPNPVEKIRAACKAIGNIFCLGAAPLYATHTKIGEGFHFQCYVEQKENLCHLGGTAAQQLPVYHPTLMFMIDAVLKGQGRA